MDLDQRLNELGRTKREEVLTDQQQMERLKRVIRQNIQRPSTHRRWMPVPIVLSLLLICIGVWMYPPWDHVEQIQMPLSLPNVPPETQAPPASESPKKESEKPLVLEDQFAFAADFVDWMQRYTTYEIKQVTASPFADVFEATDQAVLLETNKGKLHVVFFPNPGEAEKVEIDEDFTVRGQITFTFTGAKLKEGVTTLHATGPTYQYSYDNLLFLSSNSHFVSTFRSVFSEFDNYKIIFANFGLNFDEYTYLIDLKRDEEIDQNPDLAIHKLHTFWWASSVFKEPPIVLKAGDRKPGVFVRNGTYDDVISIYAAGDGIHHLFRLKWDNERKIWAPVEHKQKPGKSKQRSS